MVGDGAGGVSPCLEHLAEVVVGSAVIGVQTDRRLKVVACLGEPALRVQQDPEVVVGVDQPWCQLEGATILGDALVHVALLGKDIRQIVVRHRDLGIDRERRVVLGDRVIQPALRAQRDREIAVSPGKLRIPALGPDDSDASPRPS